MGRVIKQALPKAIPIMCGGVVDNKCPFLKRNKKIPWLRQCTRELIIKVLIKKYDENAMINSCCGQIAGDLKRKYQPVVLQFREKEA